MFNYIHNFVMCYFFKKTDSHFFFSDENDTREPSV